MSLSKWLNKQRPILAGIVYVCIEKRGRTNLKGPKYVNPIATVSARTRASFVSELALLALAVLVLVRTCPSVTMFTRWLQKHSSFLGRLQRSIVQFDKLCSKVSGSLLNSTSASQTFLFFIFSKDKMEKRLLSKLPLYEVSQTSKTQLINISYVKFSDKMYINFHLNYII